MILKGRKVNDGRVEGEAIVYNGMFSFLGDIDPRTGKVPVKGHPLEGQSLSDKIFVFTTGKGSTAGPFVAYEAKKRGVAPRGMICQEAEPVIALGAIMANIPMVDKLDKDPLKAIQTGDHVKLNADEGIVEVVKKGSG